MANILPLIMVKDFKGNVLRDTVTSFRYKYSEEGDDVCEITFEDSDPFLADRPEFQEGKKLQIAWGYVGGKMSKTRSIFIFDTENTYEDIVKLKLICHEKFALAKMDVATNKNVSTLKKDTPLILSPEVLLAMNVQLEKGNKELEGILKSSDIQVKDKAIITSQFRQEDNVVSFYNGNKSTYQGLRTFLNSLPGGPYIIDSRDESVLIRKRNLTQSPKRVLTWRGGKFGGEILSFKPEKKTRSKASGSEKITVSNWDPVNQKANIQESSSRDYGQIKLSNSNLIDDWYVNYAPTKGKNPNPNAKSSTPKLLSLGGFPGGKRPVLKKVYTGADYNQDPSYGGAAAKSSTAVFQEKFRVEADEPQPKDVLLSPEHSETKAKALANNIRADNEVKNEKGSAELVGDPEIESGMIVNFQGVANKDKGNYYIFECEHVVDGSGYRLSLSQIGRQGKNVKSAKVSTVQNNNEQDFLNNASKLDGSTGVFIKKEGFYVKDGIAINDDNRASAEGAVKINIPVKKASE